MLCSHCNKPIVLVPSAQERARKYGGSASDYTSLFTIHPDCALKLRREDVSELINRHYS